MISGLGELLLGNDIVFSKDSETFMRDFARAATQPHRMIIVRPWLGTFFVSLPTVHATLLS